MKTQFKLSFLTLFTGGKKMLGKTPDIIPLNKKLKEQTHGINKYYPVETTASRTFAFTWE